MTTAKPIPDFPGYEVSQDGTVWSWHGRGFEEVRTEPLALTPVWIKSNRWAVRLNKGGKRHMRCVANLVLLAFVGPPKNFAHGTAFSQADVIFRDGDPANCSLDNLAWKGEPR